MGSGVRTGPEGAGVGAGLLGPVGLAGLAVVVVVVAACGRGRAIGALGLKPPGPFFLNIVCSQVDRGWMGMARLFRSAGAHQSGGWCVCGQESYMLKTGVCARLVCAQGSYVPKARKCPRLVCAQDLYSRKAGSV